MIHFASFIIIQFASECVTTFRWLTRAVCPTVADQCTLAYGGHVYDLSVLSRQQGSWNLTDAQGNRLVHGLLYNLLSLTVETFRLFRIFLSKGR